MDEVNLGSARPDLWVEALSDVDYAMPGETVVQTLIYGNQGGASTSETLITYTLPGGAGVRQRQRAAGGHPRRSGVGPGGSGGRRRSV